MNGDRGRRRIELAALAAALAAAGLAFAALPGAARQDGPNPGIVSADLPPG